MSKYTYIQNISEYVRNTKYTKAFVNDLINAIRNIDKWSYVENIKNDGNEFGFFSFDVNPKFEKQISKLLNRFIYKANRIGYMLYIDYTDSRELNGTLKEPKLKRVKPTKYVYHLTPEENVEYILVGGLKTEFSESDYWGSELIYPDAIFASLETDEFGTKSGNDVMLKIDTDMIPNKWWVDLNFYLPNLNILTRDFIMTFDDIPPEAISLKDVK